MPAAAQPRIAKEIQPPLSGTPATAWAKTRSFTVVQVLGDTEASKFAMEVPSLEIQPKKFVAELVKIVWRNWPPLIDTLIVLETGVPFTSVAKKNPPIAVGVPAFIRKLIGKVGELGDSHTSEEEPTFQKSLFTEAVY